MKPGVYKLQSGGGLSEFYGRIVHVYQIFRNQRWCEDDHFLMDEEGNVTTPWGPHTNYVTQYGCVYIGPLKFIEESCDTWEAL